MLKDTTADTADLIRDKFDVSTSLGQQILG